MRDKFAFQAWGKWGLYGVGYERDRGDVFWGEKEGENAGELDICRQIYQIWERKSRVEL